VFLDDNCTYLCGNSLGPLSKRSETLIQEELQVWRTRYVSLDADTPVSILTPLTDACSAVKGHFSHPYGREWMNLGDHVTPLLAEVVGGLYGLPSLNGRIVYAVNYRGEGERSSMYGHVDYESAPHDGLLLQTYPGTVQNLV
jgi:hypothetical protein